MGVNSSEGKQESLVVDEKIPVEKSLGGDDEIPVETSLPERTKGSSSDDDKPHAIKDHPGIEIPIVNDVERVDQTNLSFAAILKGTAANPLNVFEKKAALINVEIDNFGMGRYQICIWFLCGFGYFLDLAWSQGVGLIVTAIYQEVRILSFYSNRADM